MKRKTNRGLIQNPELFSLKRDKGLITYKEMIVEMTAYFKAE